MGEDSSKWEAARGQTTATSMASALESPNPVFSISGFKRPSLANLKTQLRIWLCLMIVSRVFSQHRAWSPMQSMVCMQRGQGNGDGAIGRPKRR